MEIDITRLANESTSWKDYISGPLDIGPRSDARTWEAALDDAHWFQLFPLDACDDVKSAFQRALEWMEEDIKEMDHKALQALTLQWIAGYIRYEVKGSWAPFTDLWWQEYDAMSGHHSIFRKYGKVFYKL